MVVHVHEIVPRVNQLLIYGETIAPTEQHARLIMNWHNIKNEKFSIQQVEDGWLIKMVK